MKLNWNLKAASLYLFVLPLLGGLLMTSCGKEEGCTDPEAENYDASAELNDRSCTYARDKFVGTYDVDQSCPVAGDSDFTLQVSQSSVNQRTIVLNMTGTNTVKAEVEGSEFTILSGEKFTLDGVVLDISGSGMLSASNAIDMTFTLRNGPLTETCAVTGQKQ